MQNRESEHDQVYGASFALYDRATLDAFIAPFRVRFARNSLDPAEIFAGRRCLDAGCGTGRGAIFMLADGAASVDCVDVSLTNVTTASRNLRERGFAAFTVRQASLERLPFEDESFDVVWCNGVLQHTADPAACLAELARVLRRGGVSWIYVYGAGGLYWWAVERFRRWMAATPAEACIATLRLMRYPVDRVAEFLDDWKVAYLRTYTAHAVSSALSGLGFATPRPLPFGMPYDTSERRARYPGDAPWLGEGDLRYLATKEHHSTAPVALPSAPAEAFAPAIAARFDDVFAGIERATANATARLAAAAHLQYELRAIMSREGPLDVAAFAHVARDVETYCRGTIGV